ncbi:MAG TPA: DNA cytosine methyltransferase [Myxococcota bacterium]|nr:DNA cytosine methyltransferase [Myxococcota bacterium]HOS61684.1 DNA cytosine methyltransferase [Myxococcota bacterium]
MSVSTAIPAKETTRKPVATMERAGFKSPQCSTIGQNNYPPKNTPVSDSRFSVVSLFSGCGGLDLGFVGGFEFLGAYYEKTLFDIAWANEINSAACRTYRKNIGGHIVEGDIWDALPNAPESADIVIGGFPCQDISVNGKGAGVEGKRSRLYLAMVEAVSRIRPKVFVAENVKGLLMKHNKKSLEQVLSDFRALGYEVSYRLYQAVDFGVPQTRERVFIVGTRPDAATFVHPEPVCSSYTTAREAIGDVEHLDEDEEFNHIWSLADKSPEQGNRKMVAERAGYTIRAECHGNMQFHYSLPRRISMREAARFQSFPDSFIFDAKLRETKRQVGNAVPPVLAWHIAKAVENVLTGGEA